MSKAVRENKAAKDRLRKTCDTAKAVKRVRDPIQPCSPTQRYVASSSRVPYNVLEPPDDDLWNSQRIQEVQNQLDNGFAEATAAAQESTDRSAVDRFSVDTMEASAMEEMLKRIVQSTKPDWAEQLQRRVTVIEENQKTQADAITKLQQEVKEIKADKAWSASSGGSSAGFVPTALEFKVCQLHDAKEKGVDRTIVEPWLTNLRSKLSPVHNAMLGRLRFKNCLLYTSPSPRDATLSRMPSSA